MTTQLTHGGENSAGPAAPAPVPDPVASAAPRAPASTRPGSGRAVRVITCYPTRHGLGLYSLAVAIRFCCAVCLQQCEATLIATRFVRTGEGSAVCPSCYAHLAGMGPTRQERVSESRRRPRDCVETSESADGREVPAVHGVFAGETRSDH
jgi:hypothetical protein